MPGSRTDTLQGKLPDMRRHDLPERRSDTLPDKQAGTRRDELSGGQSMDRAEAHLSRPYLSVRHDGCPSYGGSQNWFSGMLKSCGCGIISAADVFRYLGVDDIEVSAGINSPESQIGTSRKQLESNHHGNRAETGNNKDVSKADLDRRHAEMDFIRYEKYVRSLQKRFPLIPFRGMPGFVLAFYMNLYLRAHHAGYWAHWGCMPGKLRQTVTEMLHDDIPVPFCVGACYADIPSKGKHRGLRLYERREAQGRTQYIWTKTVRNHFMVITGVSGNRARISSWGGEYYISLKELERLAVRGGLGFSTNIIRIHPTSRTDTKKNRQKPAADGKV